MKHVISIAIIIIGLTQDSYAINKELGKVWEGLGGESVSNGARFYKGQKRGHYTMGSMYFAKKKVNRPLISVNFPDIDLDKSCYNQGVLNFGGASFISGDELKNKLQNIGQQAGMMFTYLGVSTISPVIGETLQEVYSKLQEVGGFLSDECQAAKQIVSFVGDKMSQHSAAAKELFTKFRTGDGSKGDLSSAYSDFPKGKSAALSAASDKDERLTLENVNLAWKAMEKLKINNQEIKEMMMTISGTVIIKAAKNDHGAPTVQYISSKVVSPTVLEALLKGNKGMQLLSCVNDKGKCLEVSEKERFINAADSFEQKVEKYFDMIKKALEEDEELEISAQNFLANAGLAAYKIYDVLYQHSNGNPEYEQGIIVEIVAWNILYNYLSDILKEVNEASNNLQISATEELKDYKESIKSAQKLLSEYEMKDISRYKLQLALVKRAEGMEDSTSDEMSQIINMTKMSH